MSHITVFQPEEPASPVVLSRYFLELKEAAALKKDVDPNSELFLQKCEQFLVNKGHRGLDRLRGSQAEEAADFFDMLITTKLQENPKSPPEYRRRMMRNLRLLSGSWGVLPASYTLQGEVQVSDVCMWTAGGYSEVWRGTMGCKMVAVKVIKIGCASNSDLVKLKEQLSKEAIIWKHLKHRNILPFYGVSTSIEVPSAYHICLVSPWMENSSILEFFKRNPGFNRFKLLVDACKGLAYLHSEGFVHGDLKGPNVLIDSENRALLADFGFARVCNPPGLVGASDSSDPGGTTHYMAPELFLSANDDQSTYKPSIDVFALGSLIYEVLSGQAPLCGRDTLSIQAYVSKGTKLEPPPWTLDQNHRAWDMVNFCRAKEPEDRPDLAEVLDFLTHASRDPPVEWPLPPARNLLSSSFGSPQMLAPVQAGARSLLKCATVQMLAYQDDTGLRWKAVGGKVEKLGPGPKKRKTS